MVMLFITTKGEGEAKDVTLKRCVRPSKFERFKKMRKFGKHRDKYSGRGHAGGNAVAAGGRVQHESCQHAFKHHERAYGALRDPQRRLKRPDEHHPLGWPQKTKKPSNRKQSRAKVSRMISRGSNPIVEGIAPLHLQL
jgi:hypothetical protein